MTRTVQFHHKHVGAAGGSDITGPEINGVFEAASGIDVAGPIHRYPFADLAGGAAQGGGPLMSTSRIQFGDERILGAGGGDVTGPEINRACELAAGIDVAGPIHRHPLAEVGAGAAEGGGPLMSTSSVAFGDKHVIVARGGDVARPEIHCVLEGASGVHVAGTIHRHPTAVVLAGAAERDRPIIRVVPSSRVPRTSRRTPPHNHQHANSSQS